MNRKTRRDTQCTPPIERERPKGGCGSASCGCRGTIAKIDRVGGEARIDEAAVLKATCFGREEHNAAVDG